MKLFTAFRAVGLAGLIAASFTSRLLAQDIIVTAPQWSNPANPFADELPVITKHPELKFPAVMADKEQGYVLQSYWLSDEGVPIAKATWASHPAFEPEGKITLGYKFSPAKKEGAAVDAPAWHAVIFNPDSASERGRNVRPRLLAAAPVFADRADLEGIMPKTAMFLTVWSTVKLGTQGEVVEFTIRDSEYEKFRPQIQQTLALWRFAPARERGEPVSSELPVAFALARKPGKKAPGEAKFDVPPKIKNEVTPSIPRAVRGFSRAEGMVQFTVKEDGTVENVSVVKSNHPDYEEPVLKAVRQWTFKPGLKDGKPVKVTLRRTFNFTPSRARADQNSGTLSMNELSKKQMEQLPEELRYDVPPSIKGVLTPAYPYSLLLEKIGGEVEVMFLVGVDGRVSEVKVMKADRPEFGEAMVAAVAAYEFVPASRGGQPTMTLHKMKHRFDPSGWNGRPSDEDLAMLSVIRKHPERILSAKVLDAPLKPISQRAPVMPSTVKATEGAATIEIIIDKEGRACLPRVLKATDPVFGYAAAQAVTDWRFEKPLSQGKAVLVRVAVPVILKPPTAVNPTVKRASASEDTPASKPSPLSGEAAPTEPVPAGEKH